MKKKKNSISRRRFLTSSVMAGAGCTIVPALPFNYFANVRNTGLNIVNNPSKTFPTIKTGEKQLVVDDVMITQPLNIQRRVHTAAKLDEPVLEANMPWEQGNTYNGKKDRRIYIYGTVLREPETRTFRMWYNRLHKNYYATSYDGVNWKRPNLNQLDENNMINLFNFHSPSLIRDDLDPDPAKRYKMIGCLRGFSKEVISNLKKKFKTLDWYNHVNAYSVAYSSDGLNWKMYPENPVLLSSDTITLSQDPVTGEYLAFHKIHGDPRTKPIVRQIYLSVSKDMQNWSEPELVMITDDKDHAQARLLKGGTHSEFYNMSAFPYGNQWLGLVTHFRRTGRPPVIKAGGFAQSHDDGPIDVQLVHSRDGRNWKRCSDRSPVIPLGPHQYDSGSILGLCNSPVIVGDEMWMYYTAMTTTHGGYLPDKEMSIARAAWRLDRMVSLQAGATEGNVETIPFFPDGRNLFINSDTQKGSLFIEILDINREVIPGFEKGKCKMVKSNKLKQHVSWKNSDKLPEGKPICLRFFLKYGDLFSYTIE